MIELNTEIKTKISAQYNISGVYTKAELRFIIISDYFFVGFYGNDKEIIIPELNSIQFPSDIVKAQIEIKILNYSTVIWEEDIKLINQKTLFESNNIKIHIELKSEKNIMPKILIQEKEI